MTVEQFKAAKPIIYELQDLRYWREVLDGGNVASAFIYSEDSPKSVTIRFDALNKGYASDAKALLIEAVESRISELEDQLKAI